MRPQFPTNAVPALLLVSLPVQDSEKASDASRVLDVLHEPAFPSLSRS